MTKRIHKIGIAARLTAVVAVILAVFLVPWVWRVAELAQDEARRDANAVMSMSTDQLMRDLENLKGDAARYPAAGTEEYDLLRANLCRDGVDTPYYNVNTPYIIRYYDENHKRVLIRSPLMLNYRPATGCCYGIDLSDFSEQSLREMNEILGHEHAQDRLITVYGQQIKTDTGFIFFPNRLQIGIGDGEWTAQTPVEETNQFRSDEGDYIQGVWPFRTDEVMEGYFDALRYLDTELRAIDGENIPDEEWAEVRASQRYVGTFQGMPYDDEVLLATAALVNRENAYGTCFHLMLPITIALYLIFLFLFYKIVRRMVSDPLVDTAREANRVSILAFDEFKPALNRGDEIGELNRALSEMAATLHTRWDSERDLEDKRQQFVSAASHDLKTPLALIGGYAEAIAQDISPEENARYLAAIEQETARMNGLVREMLDYTRLDRTDELKNRKTLNLTALVRDMLTEYAPLFEKRRLTADIADGVRIRGDETLLRRAVGCLLENAAKYSPENGRVSVRLTNSRNDLLTVENDCEPIPETELPRLFEMFYRGDKARDRAGGHGLGLAILQKILALHGLTCKAENIKGGVRFIVCNKD
ncbi:MAG: HAMP domain-containing sensor histidine kinase [Eubacteriales bacterium]|nr:HAMP domain-containing sensor histidine kinase [Eubacteriales bacterium]